MTKEERQRTLQQNKALFLFCTQLSKKLNEAGLDMKTVLKPEIDIPWTKATVKDHLWDPILEAMTKKTSTTKMNTVDPGNVYEVLNRHLSEKFGISVPWPDKFGPKV